MSSKYRKIFRALVLALITQLVACGGGSTGSDTGGALRSATISGSLVSTTGASISGAVVRAPASDATSISGASGGFILEVPIVDETAVIEVEREGLVSSIEIPGFSQDENQSAAVIIEVGETLRLVSVTITPRSTPAAQPTQSSPPTPIPTHSSGRTPGASPSPTVARPTPTPQVQSSELIVEVSGFRRGPLEFLLVETGARVTLARLSPIRFTFPVGLPQLTLQVTGLNSGKTNQIVISNLPTYPATVHVTLEVTRSIQAGVEPQFGIRVSSVDSAPR